MQDWREWCSCGDAAKTGEVHSPACALKDSRTFKDEAAVMEKQVRRASSVARGDGEIVPAIPPDEVEYSIHAVPDDQEIRGNALASGNDDYDREVEDELINRAERGDVWAWASVTVRATFRAGEHVFTGADYLGGCSYENEADFKTGGYFEDMKSSAFEDLKERLAQDIKRGKLAADVLEHLESLG